MDLYNRLELGDIRNISDNEYFDFLKMPIYQILPWKYVQQILEKGVLRFNNINKFWEDPYELCLFNEDIIYDRYDIKDFLKESVKRYYGQCWSINRDSDAMWRIYSHDKQSVRIKTTILKLIEVLNQTRGMGESAPLFGKVRYVSKGELIKWLYHVGEKGWGHFCKLYGDSLFIKRIEFSHEAEVRFVIYQLQCHKVKEFIELHVDPFDLIDEIALDPRLSRDEYQQLKNNIVAFSKNIIVCQSDLYKFTPIHLHLKDTPLSIENVLDYYKKRNKENINNKIK